LPANKHFFMTPLLKKEIRLLLPAWGAALLLVLAAIWFLGREGQPHDILGNFTPVWLGIMMLCASSFGREFSLGTFSSLMAQPVRRQTFWLVKVGVLAAALLSVLLVYSCLAFSSLHAVLGWSDTAWLVVLLLTAIAGGLWLALALRQMVAVVWLVAIVPGGLCAVFMLPLAHYNAADQTMQITIFMVLLLYSIVGIAGSWRIFQNVQDGPATEGAINLPVWMSMISLRRGAPDIRRHAPLRTLIWKELHFNQVLLAGMGGMFLLQLAEVIIRRLRINSPGDLNDFLQGAGILLWLVVPLIIGCSNIAEERRLGMMESQLCLPVSTRRQFLVKLLFVITAGGLLSTALPWLAEWLGCLLGLDNHLPDALDLAGMCAGLTAIALISFYASSLTRNVHHAPVLALALGLGIAALFAWFVHISGYGGSDFLIPGVVLWNPLLPGLILTAVLTLTLPWLAYRNFRCLHETARVWRRNCLALAAAVAFTMAASVLLYHRAWERLTPFEPAHGPARWTLAQPPVAVRTDLFNNLLITQPDGPSWFGCLAANVPANYDSFFSRFIHDLVSGPPQPRWVVQQAIPGTNWVSLAPGQLDMWVEPDRHARTTSVPPERHVVNSRETVGIRSDGTLWVSAQPGAALGNTHPLVQYGTNTDWLAVQGERSLASVLLLKRDGTLWRWGDGPAAWWQLPAHWMGLRNQIPRQIGTDTNWQSLLLAGWPVAQKSDGTVWNIRFSEKDHRNDLMLNTNFTAAGLTRAPLDRQKIAGLPETFGADVRPDGTLWIWGHLNLGDPYGPKNPVTTRPSGTDTNWLSVALGMNTMVALKSDGTLWRWGGPYDQRAYPDRFTGAPKRLGIHQDWLALAQVDNGFVTLAADGSLWFWRDMDGYGNTELLPIKPSEKPIPLGNILAANH